MVTLYRSTFGLPAGPAGETTISSKDLYRISAAPMPSLVGKATGGWVAGAISNAPVATYKSTLEAQNAGIQNQVLNLYAQKQSTTAEKIILADKKATGGGNITTPTILTEKKDTTTGINKSIFIIAGLIAAAMFLK